MHRGYPGGINGSHIFGYLKEISQKQLKKENEYYNQGDNIGNTGVEKSYEKELRGTKGNKFVIVNSRRKVIDAFNNGAEDISAVKGHDLILTIETNAQRVAEEEFKGKKGALVAIEPATGEITWMATEENTGDHVISIEANDGDGGVTIQTFVVKVNSI